MQQRRPTVSKDTPWIHVLRGSGEASVRLMCLPFAGSSAQTYYGWREHLPAWIELATVQLPGRSERFAESAHHDIDQICAGILGDLDILDAGLPLAIFGHSMGALIGFELAHRLQRQGRCPTALWVSGRRAPHLPPPRGPIHALPGAAFLAQLRQLGGTPAEALINTELMELLEPTLRADFAVIETHVHSQQAMLECSILAFGGDMDPDVDVEHLDAWMVHTDRPGRVELFRGGHFFLRDHGLQLCKKIAHTLSTSRVDA